MDIKNPNAPCMCFYIILWNINKAKKHAINDKLQGSVATYLKCGGVISNLIKNVLFLSPVSESFFESVNIWERYNSQQCWVADIVESLGEVQGYDNDIWVGLAEADW